MRCFNRAPLFPWRHLPLAATLLALLLALAACAAPGSFGETAGAQPTGAIADLALPVSIADAPAAAALRTAPRLALVIGNDDYRAGTWSPLRLAAADGAAMAEALRRRGFTLIGGGAQRDVTAGRFRELLAATETAIRAQPGAVVIVYFAGHGFAAGGHNYLVPVDAPARAQAVAVSPGVAAIADRLQAAGSGVTALFLDACRDYAPGDPAGLADEAAPDNTFIGFATQFGGAAKEPPAGQGTHGYYTAALLQGFDSGTGRFDDMHLGVSAAVLRATGLGQAPVFREGGRMPAAPVRLASADPQTAFALAAQRGNLTGGAGLAAQCAAAADLRLVVSVSSPETRSMSFGPRYEPVDLEGIVRTCAAAYAAGRHEVAVLRGLGLARYILAARRGSAADATERTAALALVTEAAESGDALSNFAVALAATAKNNLGLPFDAAEGRLMAAAARNEAPLTGIIGLLLWHPEAAAFRADAFLRANPAEGYRLFRQAVVAGDPAMQPIAFQLALHRDPAVAGLPLRDAMRQALVNGSAVGFAFPGVSVRQSLYPFAIAAALNAKDYAEFARLVLEAEAFLDVALQGYARTSGNAPGTGLLFQAAGCIFATGRDPEGRSLIMPNRDAGLYLLRRGAATGFPLARQNLERVMQGALCQ